MPGVSATGSVDRRLVQVAEDSGVLPKGVSPHGKTAAETKESQKPTLLKGLGITSVKTAAEALLHGVVEHGSGLSAATTAVLLGPGLALRTLTKAFHEAHEQGQAINEANARDAVNLLFVWAAAGALPPAYVNKLSVDQHLIAGAGGGATRLLSRLTKDAAVWEQVKKEAAEHSRIGRDTANRLGVTSKPALEARLKTDRQFAAAYQQNLGFKHGVDSVIYDNVQRMLYGK